MKRASLATLVLGAVLVADTATVTAKKSLDRWNWSNNIEFTAKLVEKPTTVEGIQTAVKSAKGQVKVVGTAHSFSDIADTDGTHITLENFTDIKVDTESRQDLRTVTFGAGITYTQLINALKAEKMALYNLPSLPHINVVGSVVTGTHGSGIDKGSMGSYVTAIAFVDVNGNMKRLTRRENGLEFKRYLHSFGVLGIIYEMTMDITQEYGVTKCIYQDVPWDSFLHKKKEFKELNDNNNFLSYFTDWQEESMNSIWLGSEISRGNGDYSKEFEKADYLQSCPETLYGGKLVKSTHPIPGLSSEACVESGFGMWNDKIYHFLPDKPPSADGAEIQSEFFVKYADMPDAVADLYSQAHKFRDFVQITEIRGVARDNIPLSPAKGQTMFGIHFTWKHDFDNVYFAVKEVQQILSKYDYRVHWGKFFHPTPDYGVFSSFVHDLGELKHMVNMSGNRKFVNCFAERLLYDNDNCQMASNFEIYAEVLEAKKRDQKPKEKKKPTKKEPHVTKTYQHSDEL